MELIVGPIVLCGIVIGIDYVSRRLFERLAARGELCTVCQRSIGVCGAVTTAPCGHVFHRNCLRRWEISAVESTDRAAVCPNCRDPIVAVLRRV